MGIGRIMVSGFWIVFWVSLVWRLPLLIISIPALFLCIFGIGLFEVLD